MHLIVSLTIIPEEYYIKNENRMIRISNIYFLFIGSVFIIILLFMKWTCSIDEWPALLLLCFPNFIVIMASLNSLLSIKHFPLMTSVVYVIYSILFAIATFLLLPVAQAANWIHLFARSICCLNIIFSINNVWRTIKGNESLYL